MRKRLLLLRHAETSANRKGQFTGLADVPLSERGRRQALATSELVRQHTPQLCLSSPLQRSLGTARLALPDTETVTDPDLREIDFGQWDGLTFTQVQQQDPAGLKRWLRFDPDFRFETGESLGNFFNRVRRVAKRILSQPEERILIVTHGGILRALLCQLLKLTRRHFFLFDIRPATLAVVDLFESSPGVLTELRQPATEYK